VLAVDLDEIAVQAARENVETNGLAERIVVGRGSVDAAPDRERYDLVVANIIARVIVDLAPALAARVRPGGRLVASGILDVRRDEVAAALAAGGLAVEETLTEADWIALVCRKDSA
jgi:ribosomal protein L11 methyltransferase